MFDKDWMALKATFAFPPLLLCAVSYAIFRDEFFGQHISASLLVCFSFLFPWFLFVLGGICVIRRKPYAKDRLFEELRDCDLETEKEIGIKPLNHRISNPIQQFFMNIYSLCVFRPVYGIMLSVGFVVLSAICCFLVRIQDPELEADLHFACIELIIPSLVLIAAVVFLANSGLYTSTRSCELQSYHPFEESVEVPISVLFGRAFAAVLKVGRLNIFYALLLFVYVMVAVNFLDQIKNSPVKTMEEWQMRSEVPSIQFLISALTVLSIASGFFLLVQLILSAYVEAKQCTLAIIEKDWRRNIRAMEYLVKGATYENLEDLQDALDAKRIGTLSDNEIKAFDYIAMPLWRTRRPFVNMTPDDTPRQENADLAPENLETAEESPSELDPAAESVQEQEENPEDNTCTDDRKEEGTSSSTPSTSSTTVTRRHTRQLSIVNVDIKPAKITRRRQEVPIPEEVPEEEEVPQNGDGNKDEPQDESSGTSTRQAGSSKTEPTRVTRRREYYD